MSDSENSQEAAHTPEISKPKIKKKSKFSICSVKKLRKCSENEIFTYITDMHESFAKNEKKLRKYKDKIRSLKKIISKLTQKLHVVEKEKASTDEAASGAEAETERKDVHGQDDDKDPQTFLDEIREAAESAQNKTGFIYEPTSGLYYDQSTGYYYNAEYGLYYDGNTGCYYKYDQDRNEFEFHSQVEIDGKDIDKENLRKAKNRKRKRKKDERTSKELNEFNDDQEDGEILSDSSSNGDSEVDEFDENPSNGHYEDIAKKYPPSLRLIVQDTNLDKLKVGALYMITFKGGTLGREGDHDVIIPDLNVSKYHLKFEYNEDKGIYQCIDLGSRNGTILNGVRMSTGKQESETFDLVHGSIIQIGQTKLLCHTHPGNSTCGLCEPGLLMEAKDTQKLVTLTHKEQLKKLQKRYGLENEKYVETKSDLNYKDRAATRREKVGSTTDKEKTETASVHTEISSQNKGFKMLSKLGWNKGEALGKTTAGLLEPIAVTGNEGKKGLGCDDIVPNVDRLTKIDLKKINTWRMAQKRYDNLPKSDMFNDSNSSSD